MGKKTKKGKQRKDKFYFLAKETGYRARSAFKLIQLNRKFEFLSRARILVDLCAAPGGWMQVAQQNMPMSSLIIGVDLVPIKSVHKNCLTIQDDICSDSCRRELDTLTQQQQVDVVLHDGAPNVGQNWLQDAFSQAQLVLQSLKLATRFLRKGGWFVTKIFRSKDHPALIAVFNKLFTKVHVTKPQASRNESAEIFAVCAGYLKPKSVDPALLDPKSVFRDLNVDSDKPRLNILHPEKKKSKAEGYDEGDLTVYHTLPASKFIEAENFIELLGKANEIALDGDLGTHSLTTPELASCLKDIQVLGRKELRLVLNWRKAIRQQLLDAQKDDAPTEPAEPVVEQTEEEKLEDEIAARQYEEKQEDKRKKRKVAKEKAKKRREIELEMVHPGDVPDFPESDELFNLVRVAKRKAQVEEGVVTVPEPEEKEEEDEEDEDGEDLEWEDGGAEELAEAESMVVTEDTGLSKAAKSARKTELWFDRTAGLIPDVAEDGDPSDDEEFDAILQRLKENKARKDAGEKQEKEEATEEATTSKEKAKAEVKEESESESSDDDEDDAEPMEQVRELDAEGQALGTLMVRSKKARRDIEDDAWNRYSFNDTDVPIWFAEDEKKHMRKPLPVPKGLVEEYEKLRKGVGVAGIKRVVEAKARKRKREQRRVERTRKKANNVMENTELGQTEKMAELRKLYKQANAKNKKETVEYVVAKKGSTSGRKVRRPPGIKGKFKVVDPRMKKDVRAAQNVERKAKGKGGKHGGKNKKANFGHKAKKR